jgi:hypothetical protein
MKHTTMHVLAVATASVAILFTTGCDKAGNTAEPKPSLSQAARPQLNAQGVAFAKMAYLDEISNAIQGNDTVMTMEEGLKLSQIDLRVDAHAYANDYEANEIAADDKYKGKKILLIGKVNSINKDISGKGYLSLRGPGMFQDVQARLSNAGLEGAATLKKGVTIYLVCDHGMKVATMTTARNCERYSQHLETLRPKIEKSVTAFLAGDLALPQSQAQIIAMGYVLGSELPADSPCLKDVDACYAEFAKITNDKVRQSAFKEKITTLLKSLKTT